MIEIFKAPIPRDTKENVLKAIKSYRLYNSGDTVWRSQLNTTAEFLGYYDDNDTFLSLPKSILSPFTITMGLLKLNYIDKYVFESIQHELKKCKKPLTLFTVGQAQSSLGGYQNSRMLPKKVHYLMIKKVIMAPYTFDIVQTRNNYVLGYDD